jgi:hypothetical protein
MNDLENTYKKSTMIFTFWVIFHELNDRHSKNLTNDITEKNEKRISKDYQIAGNLRKTTKKMTRTVNIIKMSYFRIQSTINAATRSSSMI